MTNQVQTQPILALMNQKVGPLAGLPHLVRPVIVEPDQAAATLARLVQLVLAGPAGDLDPAHRRGH